MLLSYLSMLNFSSLNFAKGPVKILLVLLVFNLFSACDQIKAPYTESLPPPGGDTDTTTAVKKVLLEDYTGFYCGTCPPASEIAASLDSIYGERLVVLGIHANFFADVSLHSAPYNSPDMRTPAGEEYYTFFGISSNPSGMVNRKKVSGDLILSKNAWGAAVANALAEAPEMKIKLTPQYNAANRKVSVACQVTYAKPGSEYDKVVLMITETPVTAAQKDYRLPAPSDILDYKHKHVLRGNLNGTWGDLLNTSAPAAGTVVTKNYDYTLPSDINPDNAHVVAFVHRQKPDSQSNIDREVIQVEEVSLK
jgi:thiol-disulfide isomerase/thioredoxin